MHPAHPPLVSIVVLNYNYARFVGQAIESALAQTWQALEVVVVDNGSTDNSVEVIGRYASQVRIVSVPVNIGQGHGYNVAFDSSRGEWVMWLDADDILDSDAISSCMALVHEDVAKVQFPMRLIDGESQPLGSIVPFLRQHGDVVPTIKRFGHYAGPPGSGNLYRRRAVAACFPVPPEDWPIGTDTVPFIAAPFSGQVADAGRPLAGYRLHARASTMPGYTGNFSVSMAHEVVINNRVRDLVLALLAERCSVEVPGPFLTIPTHVRHRIISWRLVPGDHPFPDDTASSLRLLMRDGLVNYPGYNVFERLLMRVWAFGAVYLPRRLALWMLGTRRSMPAVAAAIGLARRMAAVIKPARSPGA